MIERLRAAGASHVIIHGASWTDADAYLRKTFIDDQDATSDAVARNIYVPPFDHPYIWQGAETLVDEMAKQLPPRDDEDPERCSFPADVIVCSVGGGGLLNGLVGGLERHLPAQPMGKVRIVAAETAGADSLAHSLRQGSLQSLPAVSSEAITLGALCVSSQTFKYAHHPPHGIEVRSVVGTDADAARGVVQLSDMLRLEVELSCGISVQVGLDRLRELLPDLTPDSRVVIIVCGGSTISPEMIAEYRQQLNNGWK